MSALREKVIGGRACVFFVATRRERHQAAMERLETRTACPIARLDCLLLRIDGGLCTARCERAHLGNRGWRVRARQATRRRAAVNQHLERAFDCTLSTSCLRQLALTRAPRGNGSVARLERCGHGASKGLSARCSAVCVLGDECTTIKYSQRCALGARGDRLRLSAARPGKKRRQANKKNDRFCVAFTLTTGIAKQKSLRFNIDHP